MADAIRDPQRLRIAETIAADAVRESGGDLQAALVLVSQTAAFFAANVSAGYMRLAPPRWLSLPFDAKD